MRQLSLRFLFLSLMAAIAFAMPAFGGNFSCSFGKQGACLDYSDKVCPSSAKCVAQDSVCFDSLACGFTGFVCKSKLDGVAEEYESLVNKYNDLASKCRRTARKHDDLVDEFNDLQSTLEDLVSCVAYANSLEDARACAR